MWYINKVILMGRVGKDPEIKTTAAGQMATFSLATSSSWKPKGSTERSEKTEWHNVVVFNTNLVEIVRKFVKKGSRLYLEGTLNTNKWVDSNGNDRYTTSISLGFGAELKLIDSKNSEGGDGMSSSDEFAKPNYDPSELIDDDIPF